MPPSCPSPFLTFSCLSLRLLLFPSRKATPAAVVSEQPPALVVLAHGYLGSRFDLVHLAERLALKGYVVAAPEFGDARSGEVGAASPEDAPPSRVEILQQAISAAREDFGVGDRVAIVGHSAGSGTACLLPGKYPRVSIAGYAPSVDPAGRWPQPEGPLLVVASSGDCTIDFRGGMEAVRRQLPSDFQILDPLIAQVCGTKPA